jgi:plastocyanin
MAFVIGLVVTTVVLIGVLLFVPLGSDAVPYPTPAPSTGGGGGGGSPGGPPPAGDNAFNAELKEYAIALDKTQIKAGPITFNVKNVGSLPHNLSIKELNKTTENLDPGKTATLTVDLAPGTYTVICAIPGHEQLGMHTTITVQ